MIRWLKRIWKHWKRWRLRYRFQLLWPLLKDEFPAALQAAPHPDIAGWTHLEWITQPVLETEAEHQVPLCLLGVMLVFASERRPLTGTAIFFHDGERWITTGELFSDKTPTQAAEILRQTLPQGAKEPAQPKQTP